MATEDQGRKRRIAGVSAPNGDSNKVKAAAEAAARRGNKGNMKKKMQYFAIVGTAVVCLLGVIFAVVWAPSDKGKRRGGGSSGPSKLDGLVNDASFVRGVTRNADGNFTAATNPFFDKWTYGDIKWGMSGQSLSEMVGMAGAAQYCEKDDDTEGGVVPPKFDARTAWPDCVSPVTDSGNCTASYAIAAADSLSHRFCVADTEAYGNVKLSSQQILSCDKKSQGCVGGGIDFVWSYIQRRGLYPDKCLPYAGQKGATCKTDCKESDKRKSLGHCVLQGTKSIKREILNNGALVAPMVLNDDFLVYSGGVYTPTDQAQMMYGATGKGVLHAVKVLGWGKSEGTAYWLIENSWGTGWGEEGYARVAMGSVLREGYIMVAQAASEENLALDQTKKEQEAARMVEVKKERAERDARIAERQAQRDEEMRAAREASDEEDFDKEFDDDLDIDLDAADDGVDGAAKNDEEM